MVQGDKLTKRAYMRYLSTTIRFWCPKAHEQFVDEDEELLGLEVGSLARSIMIGVCRNRPRILSQAWAYWVKNANVIHDYAKDVRVILSRPLKSDELRSELEIEVMYKWVLQNYSVDPTGIAHSVHACKSRAAIIAVFQHSRIESFAAGESILFQGTLPRPEDGHFTLLSGECEVLQFPEESIPFIELQKLAKRNRFDTAKKLLADSAVLATVTAPSGFGELSSLTGVKRAATIRAGRKHGMVTDLLVVPKNALLQCLEARRDTGHAGSVPSEAIELFRQTGLANRISPKDLMAAASSMIKRILYTGDILFSKGEPATSIYLVVSGEFILDTGDPIVPEGQYGKSEPFMNSIAERCYHLSSGSILGDEGVIGFESTYLSTAVVVSTGAVIFEAVGFGQRYLTDRIRAMRYAALTYKELPRWTVPIPLAELNNLYGNFNSLRKAIAHCRPHRGTVDNPYVTEAERRAVFTLPTRDSLEALVSPSNNNNNNKATIKGKGGKGSKNKVKRREKSSSSASEAAVSLLSAPLANSSACDSKKYPKLSSTALLYAKQINAAAKKLSQEQGKVHARENILMDQLLKEASFFKLGGCEPSLVQLSNLHQIEEATKVLNRGITDYRNRNAHLVVADEQVEEQKVTMAEASKLLSLFSSAASSALAHKKPIEAREDGEDVVEEAEGGGGEDANTADGVGVELLASISDVDYMAELPEATSCEEFEHHNAIRALLEKPVIEQYLLYLMREKEAKEAREALTIYESSNQQHALTATAADTTLTNTMAAVTGSSAAHGKVKQKMDGKSWRSSPPSLENAVYWRPPSPPAQRGEDPILSSTHSRPTTRESREVAPSSPWKPRDKTASLSPIHRHQTADATGTGTTTDANAKADAKLSSLIYNPKSYSQRLKAVPSSGYGQQYLNVGKDGESGGAGAEGSLTAFHREGIPTTRRVLQLPHHHVPGQGHHFNSAETTHHDGLPHHESDEAVGVKAAESKKWDLDSPADFLEALAAKEFPIRKAHREKNSWCTRTMRVTDQANPSSPENGSEWFQRTFRQMGIREEQLDDFLARGGHHSKSSARRRSMGVISDIGMETAEDKLPSASSMPALEASSQKGGDEREEKGEGVKSEDSAWPASSSPTGEEPDEDDNKSYSSPNPDLEKPTLLSNQSMSDLEAKELISVTVSSIASAVPSEVGTKSGEGHSDAVPVLNTDFTIPAALPLAVQKPRSLSLESYQKVLNSETTSRSLLEGKKKCNTTSRFKLEMPVSPRAYDEKEVAAYLSASSKSATAAALYACLLPFGAAAEGKGGGGGGGGSKNKMSRVDSLAASKPAPSWKDADLDSWQSFSVKTALKNKLGPSKSLPVLKSGNNNDDPAKPIVKKSSLKFGGSMALLPGREEEGRIGSSGGSGAVRTYLDVFKDNYKKKDRSAITSSF